MMLEIGGKRIAVGFEALLILALSLVASVPARAQVAGATLTGTVTDASGAVIPSAQVSIKNTATGVTRIVRSDSQGLYSAPNLLPGSYDVTVSKTGFSTAVQSGVTLTVGATQLLNFTLQVGPVTQKVQVTAAPSTVQLTSSAISAQVGSTTMRQLPLNGRSWTDLAALQPGVQTIKTQRQFTSPAGAAGRGIRGFGAQDAISGARPEQNNYRLDGISINDYANAGPGSVLGGNLGVDAIQEFSVLTSNYSAEYGRTSGGVVNAITKSGTNEFHGDAYEFLRNSSLDARNFFDASIPPFRRNQFGASAGGPIQKDRTFIFGDYEGVRQFEGITQVDTVPSAAARAGNLSSGTVTVDPSAQKYLGFYALPNGPLLRSGDVGIFSFPANQIINEDFVVTRVDRRFSDRDSLFGTYMYDNTPYSAPDNLDNTLIGNKTRRQTVVLEETHSFSPTLVNAIRFGFNRALANAAQNLAAINPLANDLSLGAVPGRTAAGISVPGIAPLQGGLGGQATFLFRWNSFQVYDDAFLTKGAHSIKFGVAFERMQLNSLSGDIPNGEFNFRSLQDFLLNRPQRFSAAFPTLLTARGLRQTLFGLYAQDDWRWHPNLTFNLGLRYEMTSVPTEVQSKLSNLLHLTDAQSHLGNPYFLNPTLRNFEPRVGFAWDPFRNGKTAVRGGFGLFDVLPLPYETMLTDYLATPFFALGSASRVPPGSFYAGAFSLLTPQSLQATSIEHNPSRNYVMQWNLNVQRELAPTLTAMIGYVGSRGVHQPFRADDINIVLPSLTPQGYLWPSPVGSGTTLNPNFGSIRALMWAGNSFYDALETQITKRMSHGFQLQGSFTWGKSIDTGSATQAGDQFTNSISSLPWYNLALDRGVSDFNVGRTLVVNGIWDIPAPKSWTGFTQFALGGWEVGGIFTASDGQPFTATWGTDGDPQGLNSSDPWAFPNRLTGSGCSSLVNPGNPNNYIKTQCFTVPTAPSAAFYAANCDPTQGVAPQCFNLRGTSGRNIMTAPGIADFDFSLYKNIPVKRVSENFSIQFRAEFFNILNRASFAPPVTPDNTDIFDSTGAPTGVAGLLTSTTNASREIQFALKIIW
ncbi:MAG TPA: TonB-dependent receptor [Terriglobia bacterium]|nr:TonB-dependent receptor [Terriglobia bacterium]